MKTFPTLRFAIILALVLGRVLPSSADWVQGIGSIRIQSEVWAGITCSSAPLWYFCLQVNHENQYSGGPVTLWDCNNDATAQSWYYDHDTAQLMLANDPSLCLDNSNSVGAGVILWYCDPNNSNQKWYFTCYGKDGGSQSSCPTSNPNSWWYYKLANINQGNTVCLDVSGHCYANSAQPITYGCTGSNGLNQIWQNFWYHV